MGIPSLSFRCFVYINQLTVLLITQFKLVFGMISVVYNWKRDLKVFRMLKLTINIRLKLEKTQINRGIPESHSKTFKYLDFRFLRNMDLVKGQITFTWPPEEIKRVETV